MSRAEDLQRGIEDRFRGFLIETSDWDGSPEDLTPDFDLIGNGVIDSMGIHQLISFVQSEYGLTIEDEDLQLENFESLGRIGRLVAARLA